MDTAHLEPAASGAGPAAAGAPDLFHRVGQLTRSLHEALRGLGYDEKLEQTVGTLPDARARLGYIATLTRRAAEKVLAGVDEGQALQGDIARDARDLQARWEEAAGAERGVDAHRVLEERTREFLGALSGRTERLGGVFTEIMLAQDFHDLTGQVIQRVVGVAQGIEDQLVELLLETNPAGLRPPVAETGPSGPVIDAAGRDDVVADQAQVDDLLESLGF
ncbi:MAG: protein phosphatase CheZ [Betaproteobacteria bacterium]|nr:protein phosphatase CheZ [Betaproteobacteria bacterium]